MMDIKKIEEGLKFLDSHLAATRRFHGIETEQQVPEQPRRWWKFWRSDPPAPTLTDLYDQLYHRFEACLKGLCGELLPVFKVFVHNDGICINGGPGDVGWMKITHSRQYVTTAPSTPTAVRRIAGKDSHVLTVHFATHRVYTYEEHRTFNDLPRVKDKMELYNESDILLKLIMMWPEFQSGLDGWLADLKETNRRKIGEADKALASLGV